MDTFITFSIEGTHACDVFHKPEDFLAFVNLMREAHDKVPMRLVGHCLMTNHFHLILRPHEDGDLSRWMQWLMASHVRRYHRHSKRIAIRLGQCGKIRRMF